MADEIELKFEIENYEGLVKQLLENSKFISSAHELTIMYDENKKLFERDARLRLRKIVDLKNDSESCELSYKKPKTREGIKIEEEYEVKISDFKEGEEILKQIGFVSVSSYERIRDTFEKESVKITIDSFPFGDYIEFEGDLEKIQELAKLFGFDMEKNITKSCDDIYAEICMGQGKEVDDHIKFNSEKLIDAKNKRSVFKK